MNRSMVPVERLELPTNALRMRCSTTELHRQRARIISEFPLPAGPRRELAVFEIGLAFLHESGHALLLVFGTEGGLEHTALEANAFGK